MAIFKLENFKSFITAKIMEREIISLMIQFLLLKNQLKRNTRPITKEIMSITLMLINFRVIKVLDSL
jgi:hypothetical protein